MRHKFPNSFINYDILYSIMLAKAGIKDLVKHLNSQSRILLRVDYNVPIKNNIVLDDNRIKTTIPTITQLLKCNPKSLVILSHYGRPKGKRKNQLSLQPVTQPLSKLLNREVTFLDDCVGRGIIQKVNQSNNNIFLCQNVRFHPQEEGVLRNKHGRQIPCSPQSIKIFGEQLSKLGNIYVNDAFGAAHRAHTSVAGIAHKYRVAGFLLEKQLHFLGDFLKKAKKPVLVILGGSKVQDKIELIDSMINIADEIIIGGGMQFPFLEKMYGYKLGSTQIHYPKDSNKLTAIIQKAKSKNVKLHFSVDHVIAQQMKDGIPTKIVTNEQGIPEGWKSFDCGPQTSKNLNEVVKRANSIFWNGPLGVFQLNNFKHGSQSLLNSIVERTREGAVSIVGGGDSASLVNRLGAQKKVTYISTGGGVTLQFLKGKKLPGVQALSNTQDLA